MAGVVLPSSPAGVRVMQSFVTGWRCIDMPATNKPPRFALEIEAPANGQVRKATILALDKDGKTVHSDRANLADDAERCKLVKRMAAKLGVNEKGLGKQLEKEWNET